MKENSLVSAGYAAYIISNKDNMEVTFKVTEAAARELSVGDGIEAERDGAYYAGTITEVGTMADSQTHLFTVKASLPGGKELSTGVSVKVTADTQRSSGVLKIPYDALYFQNGQSYLYCVQEGTAVKTEVTTGLMNDTEVEIIEGITEDSLVIISWSSQLKDGSSVIVKQDEQTGEAE